MITALMTSPFPLFPPSRFFRWISNFLGPAAHQGSLPRWSALVPHRQLDAEKRGSHFDDRFVLQRLSVPCYGN